MAMEHSIFCGMREQYKEKTVQKLSFENTLLIGKIYILICIEARVIVEQANCT